MSINEAKMIPAHYQQFKLFILEIVYMSRDAIHIHIGFLALLITLIITRKKLHQWSVLVPTITISILMEVLDIWDEINTLGRILFAASLHDLLNTNFIPFILVIWAKIELKRNATARS